MRRAVPLLVAMLASTSASIGCKPDCELTLDCGPASFGSAGGGSAGSGAGGEAAGGGGQGGGPAATTSIFAGASTTCAVVREGELWCWGITHFGTLGTQPLPSEMPMQQTRRVGIGAANLCRITSAGMAECWGANSHGQIGDGTYDESMVNVPVVGLPAVTKIEVGLGHVCALGQTSLFCWGDNVINQLTGSSPKPNSTLPRTMPIGTVHDVAAGSQHNCAVKDGGVWCWGNNLSEQVDPSLAMDDAAEPRLIASVPNATAVSVGGGHSCARVESGDIHCWGSTSFGQLAVAGPAKIDGLPVARELEAGENHTCIIGEDDSVWCWGNGTVGQLGGGVEMSSTTPVEVSGLPCSPIDLSAGANHTCIICADERVACWGHNAVGQIGTGGTGGQFSTPQLLRPF